ncbi:MAG: Trm112 family protein [Candidatus Electrothrix sp. ATG2]|nr:Trm112 family protein [Candidatus Electrothrix sp. ATG2]
MKKELLDILACPKCKGKIELSEDQKALLCPACQLSYEIRDGIPVMIIEEAKPLPAEQSA